MNGAVLFLIGTLLSWVGGFLALRSVWLAVKLGSSPKGIDNGRVRSALAASVSLAGLLLLAAAALPMEAGRAGEAGWRFPIVWVVMPFAAWAALACLIMGLLRWVQNFMDVRPLDEPFYRGTRFLAGALWLAASGMFFWIFYESGDTWEIVRGGIALAPQTALALGLLAVGAVAAMAVAARASASRGVAKGLIIHLTLIVGSVVFGLPFAWLLITSFKEDRDMVSPEGLVWIPRVQQTVPFRDPERPLLEGEYEGSGVQGEIIERLPGGKVRIDILRPMALRGTTFEAPLNQLVEIDRQAPVVAGTLAGASVTGMVVRELDDGRRQVRVLQPPTLGGKLFEANPGELEPVREVGLRWQNYPDALEFLPPETFYGLVYLKNTLILVVLTVIGTVLSSSVVAYGFSRMRFPGKEVLFGILVATMMLPGAVTMLPQFLIFRGLGWIDTLLPLWVPAFFAGAFNVFLLRQFFMSIPMELEDAAKIDGASYVKTYWSVMMPQIKPALAVIAIWTLLASWNNFMGPLIYVNSPENMPISYAVQLFQGERGGEPGLLMAFTTLSMLPVLLLFFFAQKYFIEGVTLSGFGGR